ncbi:hypothetical protein JXL19_05020 [bacterium]|nr:hypothetical protein [bacterium]
MKSSYPDISGILSAKADRRKALAALSWEEKIAIVKQMQQSLPKGMWEDKDKDVSKKGIGHKAKRQKSGR